MLTTLLSKNPFQPKQESFLIQSASVARQGVIATNHTMAGNKNVNPIGTNSLCNGSDTLWIANSLCNFPISPCFSVWYLL